MGDVDKVRRELQALAADWRRLLGQQPVHARTILAKLVVGRVTFTPRSQPKQWELRGRGTIAGLFEAVFPLGMASPTGPEFNFTLPDAPAVFRVANSPGYAKEIGPFGCPGDLTVLAEFPPVPRSLPRDRLEGAAIDHQRNSTAVLSGI